MDNDLISRSAAIEALLKQPNTPTPSVIRRVLRQVPGVDAVEVVRCQECVHCRPAKDWNGKSYDACYLKANICIFERQPDDFCSYGERREENG